MAIIRLNQIGQNEYERIKAINKKIARTRRQRGYNWEDTLVKRFNATRILGRHLDLVHPVLLYQMF